MFWRIPGAGVLKGLDINITRCSLLSLGVHIYTNDDNPLYHLYSQCLPSHSLNRSGCDIIKRDASLRMFLEDSVACAKENRDVVEPHE